MPPVIAAAGTTGERSLLRMSRVTEKYHESAKTGILVLFDLRIPGVAERFERERAAWGKANDLEMLDKDHPVLLVRPGAALWRAR
jgi:hypothetical protein